MRMGIPVLSQGVHVGYPKNFQIQITAFSFALLSASSAPAAQTSQVCSFSGGKTIASYTSAGVSDGIQAGVCYNVTRKANGTWYRGSPFFIGANSIGSTLSASYYSTIKSCLMDCPNSVQGTTMSLIDTKLSKPTAKVFASDPSLSSETLTTSADTAGGKTDTVMDPLKAQLAKLNASVPATAAAAAPGVRNQSVDGPVVADPDHPGQYKQVTFKDQNGNGVQDAGDKVISTAYGPKNSEGTLKFTYGEGSAPEGATGFKYSFTDPSTGKTVFSADGSIAQTQAKARGVSDITMVDNATGQKYKVNSSDGTVESGTQKTMTDAEKKASTDPCSVSMQIGTKSGKDFRCQGTQMWVQGSQVANQILTTAGHNVINSLGSTAAQNAPNGTFASSQDAAAKMAKTSANYETALGVANLAATAKLAMAANKHKNAVADLQQMKAGAASTPGNFLTNPDGSIAAQKADATSQARYDAAIAEQTGARNLAAVATLKTAMQGAKSISSALVANKMAKDAASAAALSRKNDALAASTLFGYDPNQNAVTAGGAFDPNALAAANAGASGSATTPDGSTTNPNTPFAGLGTGNDSSTNNSINAPTPGAFKANSPSSGGGGGGAGSPAMGGGGTSGAPTSQDEAKAAYASEFGTKERFESLGGAQGGSPKAAGKGADGGIDLNGLLAQFLPKADDDTSKHSILDSVAFGGNRKVAGEEAPSYLDKNADLFQRIHETMSEKNRRGQLGI